MTTDALVDELRQLYGKTAYSQKTHEKSADRISQMYRFWYWADVFFIGIGASSLLPDLTSSVRWLPGLASLIALLLTLYHMKSDAPTRVKTHQAAGLGLWMVRETLEALLADLRDGQIDGTQARSRRDELLQDLEAIYERAPRTDRRAYAAAQKALQVNEELTFSDRELDLLLPPALRKLRLSQGGRTSGS